MDRKPIGQRPIGQVPATTPRQVHVSSAVIGSIPGAPVTRPTAPAAGIKRPAAKPAFTIAPLVPSTAAKNESKMAETLSLAKKEEEKKTEAPAHTLRAAAGEVWQDPTLADWDPSTRTPSFHLIDFR